jgi:hypothetical protein
VPNVYPRNQYTGIRAANVEFVRQYLRAWLVREAEKPLVLVQNQVTTCPVCENVREAFNSQAQPFILKMNKAIITACRLLLVCEGIRLIQADVKASAEYDRLNKLKIQIESGIISMPQLLDEIDNLEEEENDAEV